MLAFAFPHGNFSWRYFYLALAAGEPEFESNVWDPLTPPDNVGR
jgi:hypothetical protein